MGELTIRPGHPDFLDLPWERSVVDWDGSRLVDLPKGISRHEVKFLRYSQGIYAVKELPTGAARNDYGILRSLEATGAPAVRPVGLVERRCDEPDAERSAALITIYEPFSFSYRELVAGSGFGPRRSQMLDAFAGLLVELHLTGVFWGDCSLSNVLYRYDAEAIETVMVDAETATIYEDGISDGRRFEDLEIMELNVAGGMADVAAEAGRTLDEADLTLGEEIAARYDGLWDELTRTETIGADERFLIGERIARINDLGFHVEEIDLVPAGKEDEEGSWLALKVKVGGRSFHSRRLKELTGLDTLENQARQVLSDVYHHQAGEPDAITATGKNLAAIRWRVTVFEPWLDRLRRLDGMTDAVQAYCDLLHHRFVMSQGYGHDVGTDVAFDDWLAQGTTGVSARMSATALELLGYAASAVIAVSLMLVSVVRLRIVNLAGSVLFVVYGLLIDALPIVVLNVLMVGVNGYHLARLLRGDEEKLELLGVPPDSPYLDRFVAHHVDDIRRFAPGFEIDPDSLCVFVLRDAVPAGLFVAKREGTALRVELDYATPSSRDLKAGTHLYERLPAVLGEPAPDHIVAEAPDPGHARYFERMGFERRGEVLVRPFSPSETPLRPGRRRRGGPHR